MPKAMTEKNPPALNAKDVAAWLKAHPDFFQRHADVLEGMSPPKASGGKGVADFQFYMVQRLKADRDDMKESAKEIIENSRANMNIQTRYYKAILMLLDARTFEAFIHTITMDIAAVLDVDIASLAVESNGVPRIGFQGVCAVPPGTVARLTEGRPILLDAGIAGIEDIYGGGARLVRSQALVRLEPSPAGPPALLAFGSRDPNFFHPGQGTELLAFFGQVVSHLMRIWIDFGDD